MSLKAIPLMSPCKALPHCDILFGNETDARLGLLGWIGKAVGLSTDFGSW